MCCVFTSTLTVDDWIFDSLLTSMAAVQDEDMRTSFLFVGDSNSQHQEWLGSTTTNRHCVAAFDFATVSGYDQVVVGPTHARGGTLDLLMTDVPDLVRIYVVAPIGNSDHSSLSAVISMAQAVPNLCVSRKVFLKHQVNWNTVCGTMQDLPWRNIWSADNPVEVLNEHLLLLVERFVPTMVIHVRNKDKPWFDDQCRDAFCLKQEAHHWWTHDRFRVNWEEFVRCQVRANETNSEAKHQFSARNRDVLMNAQSPHKWWSILKSAVSGMSSSLPPLVGGGGGLVCESVGKGDLLSDYLMASSPGSLLICCLLTIRLRDLPPLPSGRERSGIPCKTWTIMGALTQWVCFLFFHKRTADALAPRLSEVFWRLVHLGSFPACWKQANPPVLLCCQLLTNFHIISIV